MKLIIRESNGNVREQEVTQGMQLEPTAGEQYYFTGVENYTFNLTGDNTTIDTFLVDRETGESINIVMEGMAELIQQNDIEDVFSLETAFSVSTNEAGDAKVDEVLASGLEPGEIIEALKDALSMDGTTQASGSVVDDFQGLLDGLDAAAAGGPDGTAFLTPEDEEDDLEDIIEEDDDADAPESPVTTESGTFEEPDTVAVTTQTPETTVGTTPPTDTTGGTAAQPTSNTESTPNPAPAQEEEPYNAVVTLGDISVPEGTNDAVISASVDNPPLSDLTISLDNGATITILEGETTGTSTPFGVQGDDVYVDPDTQTVTIQTTTGGGYDELSINDDATVSVNDTTDITTVDITGIISRSSTIDVNNVDGETSGVNIYALDRRGAEADFSINTNPNTAGFGVAGSASGANSELGYHGATNTSEKIVAEFDNAVESIDVSFSWRNPNEEAVLTFFNEAGESVGSAMITGGSRDGSQSATVTYYDENGDVTRTETTQGGTDRIDAAYTFAPGEGESFSKVEFTALSDGDDYLINKIDFKEIVNADTTDVVLSQSEVTLEIQTSNPPQEGFIPTATATVEVYGEEYSVELDENGKGTLDVELQPDKELTATVTQITGGNFEAVDLDGASWELSSVVDVEASIPMVDMDVDYTGSTQIIDEEAMLDAGYKKASIDFTESFEDHEVNNWEVKDDKDWDESAGVEIQTARTIGNADASDGDNYAELDTHRNRGANDTNSSNTTLSRDFDTSNINELEVSFDYKPRQNSESSDMSVTIDEKEYYLSHDGSVTISSEVFSDPSDHVVKGDRVESYDLGAEANQATVTVLGLGGHSWTETVVIKAYDSEGNLVDTFDFVGSNNDKTDFTLNSDTPFSALEVTAGGATLDEGSTFAIKNVTASMIYDSETVEVAQNDSGWNTYTFTVDTPNENTQISFSAEGREDSYGALLDNIKVHGEGDWVQEVEEPTTEEYIVQLGQVTKGDNDNYDFDNDGKNESWYNKDSIGKDVSVKAYDFDGNETDVTTAGWNIGVAGTRETGAGGVPKQLEYDEINDKSEALEFTFNGELTEMEVGFDRLIKNEGGTGEVAEYTLYDKDGNIVDTGTLADNSTSSPEFTLTSEVGFTRAVFTATQFAHGDADVRGDDSSDYFIRFIQGKGTVIEVVEEAVDNPIMKTTEYHYDIDLEAALSDTDGSETLSDITLTLGELPNGLSLAYENGDEISSNDDGVYSIKANEDGTFESVTITSPEELSQEKLDSFTASVTATESSSSDTTTATITDDGDTLLVDAQEDDAVDFTTIVENNDDVTTVDFSDGEAQEVTITAQDVDEMLTGDDDELIIKGDNGDIIDLSEDTDNDGEADWKKAEDSQKDGFDQYTNTNNADVNVFIDQEITVDIDPFS